MSKRISQAELDVMDVLWDMRGETVLATEVATKLSAHKNWDIRTVKTLLRRLVDKDVIAHKPDGRRYLYYPLLTRSEYAKRATNSLADRLFGGRVAPMVAHMAEGKGLSVQDIAELEALIKAHKDAG